MIVDASPFDEGALFRGLASRGVRALLIGRRAIIALGIPVVTGDYDIWLHIDDIERLNQALEPLGLLANRTPAEARQRGRYVMENSERVDVLVARVVPTVHGERVAFDEVWERRVPTEVAPDVTISLPAIEDLIRTKMFGARPKDAEDIRTLRERFLK